MAGAIIKINTNKLSGHEHLSSATFVQGVEELQQVLSKLPQAIANRGNLKIINRISAVYVSAIKKRVPKPKSKNRHSVTSKSGKTREISSHSSLKRRIGAKKINRKNQMRLNGKVGVGVGVPRLKKGDSGGWLNVIAMGSKDRKTKSGANRGRVQKNPFVIRGASEARPKAISEAAKTCKKFIEAETRKLAKKRARVISA